MGGSPQFIAKSNPAPARKLAFVIYGSLWIFQVSHICLVLAQATCRAVCFALHKPMSYELTSDRQIVRLRCKLCRGRVQDHLFRPLRTIKLAYLKHTLWKSFGSLSIMMNHFDLCCFGLCKLCMKNLMRSVPQKNMRNM